MKSKYWIIIATFFIIMTYVAICQKVGLQDILFYLNLFVNLPIWILILLTELQNYAEPDT